MATHVEELPISRKHRDRIIDRAGNVKVRDISRHHGYKVQITPEDIKGAIRGSCRECAIARATLRTYPAIEETFIFRSKAYFLENGVLMRVELTEGAQEAIRIFDDGKPWPTEKVIFFKRPRPGELLANKAKKNERIRARQAKARATGKPVPTSTQAGRKKGKIDTRRLSGRCDTALSAGLATP